MILAHISKRFSQSSYIGRTGLSFQNYKESFNDQAACKFNNNFIQMMQKKYLHRNKLGNSSYLEIGIGPGYVLSQFQSYFKNLCIIEPNNLYIEQATQQITSQVEPNKLIQVIDKFVDDFDPRKDLNSLFLDKKFDFINIQNVFWHVHLDKWKNVLNNLLFCLNKEFVEQNKLSLLNITHSHSQATCIDIHRYFIPDFRTVEYMIDHFNDICIERQGIEMKIIKDPLTFYLSESMAMSLMIKFLTIDLPIYGISFDDLDPEEVKAVIYDHWNRDGVITKQVDEQTGERIVELYSAATHLMLTASPHTVSV